MLGGGIELAIRPLLRLQALHEGDAHARGEERILAIGFLATAPARVTEDVDVGRPEREPLVTLVLAARQEGMVLGARFVADGGGHLGHQRGIERGRQADRLRKHRGTAGAGHAVQGFVPPIVFGHLQARDGGRGVLHLRGLFLQRHARYQIGGARLQRLRGVQIWRRWRCGVRAAGGHAERQQQAPRQGTVRHAGMRGRMGMHAQSSLVRSGSSWAKGPIVLPTKPPACAVLSMLASS